MQYLRNDYLSSEIIKLNLGFLNQCIKFLLILRSMLLSPLPYHTSVLYYLQLYANYRTYLLVESKHMTSTIPSHSTDKLSLLSKDRNLSFEFRQVDKGLCDISLFQSLANVVHTVLELF